jgi:hypothetical protein
MVDAPHQQSTVKLACLLGEEPSVPEKLDSTRSTASGSTRQLKLLKPRPHVLQSDQADTGHTDAIDQLRTKRLGQDATKHIRVYPVIDQDSPVDDATDGRDFHDQVPKATGRRGLLLPRQFFQRA